LLRWTSSAASWVVGIATLGGRRGALEGAANARLRCCVCYEGCLLQRRQLLRGASLRSNARGVTAEQPLSSSTAATAARGVAAERHLQRRQLLQWARPLSSPTPANTGGAPPLATSSTPAAAARGAAVGDSSRCRQLLWGGMRMAALFCAFFYFR
jgi:hypothetical protein